MSPDEAVLEGDNEAAAGGCLRVEVEAGTHRYPVLIGRGLLEELAGLVGPTGGHRYAVISDERVGALYGSTVVDGLAKRGLATSLFTFPPGESSKNRGEWSRLTDALLADGCGRDTVVLALGGGVTGDLAGFVAATFMRGVPVVQVPTSLVAMVDASVGGKTGVDAPAGKNLVGAFHPPRMVVTDPEVIASLPRWARAEGLVEAVKHGVILDPDYLARVDEDLEGVMDADPEAVTRVVHGSVRLKARVVAEDEYESGFRQILNFGHTLGHGIEAASGFRIRHGPAVALGMILEARLGEHMGITAPGVSDRLAGFAQRLEMPTALPANLDSEEILRFVAYDKKSRGGVARCVLLRRIGVVSTGEAYTHPLPEAQVGAVLAAAGGYV